VANTKLTVLLHVDLQVIFVVISREKGKMWIE